MITIRTLNGIAHNVDVYHDGWSWNAVEENYDGPEDHYRARSGDTKEEAVEALRESLEEYDAKWGVPNELDCYVNKLFTFATPDGRTIEFGPIDGLTYEACVLMIPINWKAKLKSITKL